MRIFKRLAAVIVACVVGITTFSFAYAQQSSEYREYGATVRTVATPKASYASGEYDKAISVKLTCSTSGARIFYTTDGTDPTYYSDIYSEPIRIKVPADETEITVTVRAYAVKTGYEDSELVEFTYTVTEPEELDVTYMEIYKNPSKTTYSKGDKLSLTGGKISVTYEDGTYKNIDMTQSMVSGFNSNTAGEKTVTVTYEGFTDTFTVNVKEGFDHDTTGAGKENEVATPVTPDNDETEEEDMRPLLSGSNAAGWSSIEKELAERAAGTNAIIMLNGAVTVPDTVIRAAAKKDIVLNFHTEDGYKWMLDTSEINKDTIIPYMGLGIRTSAIYIPSVPVNSVQGEEKARLHINSDNKLGAGLIVDVGKENKGRFAALYRYDSIANTLVMLSNVRVGSGGEAELIPDISGDYVVFVDTDTAIIGDLDNNLLVNALDAAQLLRGLVYGGILEDDAKYDVNRDGNINALDAADILKKIVMQ